MTIRVLIVDDSPTMQAFLAKLLSSDRGIEVVGAAQNAYEAREMIRALDPDVITLDIEMPGMNGLVFLEKIMTLRPMPVVIVSSMSSEQCNTAIRALELGAVDCYAKPTGGKSSWSQDGDRNLISIVKAASAATCQPLLTVAGSISQVADPGSGKLASRVQHTTEPALIAIGASTGGVEALHFILPNIPETSPPVVVVQHIASTFTPALANRLNRVCPAIVTLAEPGQTIEPGHIYVAPGDRHHVKIANAEKLVFQFSNDDLVSGHRPSIDRMFESAGQTLHHRAVGILLTGMGADGARGLLNMRKNGGHTIAQDKKTSLIYGMPRVAAQLGAAKAILPLSDIAEYLRTGITVSAQKSYRIPDGAEKPGAMSVNRYDAGGKVIGQLAGTREN